MSIYFITEVLIATTRKELEGKIEVKLKQGWEKVGFPKPEKDIYMQVMIKKNENSKKDK